MTWQGGKARTGQAWWKATRARILRRDQGRCTALVNGTRCPRRATDVDHVKNEADGGSHEDSNLTSLCPTHHRTKTSGEGVRARQVRAALAKRAQEPHPGLRPTTSSGSTGGG